MEMAAEFRDEGVSGSKEAFDRPGLTDLMVAIKTNGVRTVLIERAERLARDLMVGEIILAECRRLSVKMICAESGTDLTVGDNDPTRKLIRQVLGAVSEWDKSVIVQKLRAARSRIRKAKGRCEGRKPYGATPEEKDIIDKMHQWREAMTIVEVANRLNAEGIRPRTTSREARWHPTTVQRILAR